MAFNKRKKQYHLFRGANPYPTAEERAADEGTHVGREDHPRPHATAEEAAAGLGQHKPPYGVPVRAPAHKPHKVVRPARAGTTRRAARGK